MVFYEPLPIELWFIIYKIEHQRNLFQVNQSVIVLKNDTQEWSDLVPLIYRKSGNWRLYKCAQGWGSNWDEATPGQIREAEEYWDEKCVGHHGARF